MLICWTFLKLEPESLSLQSNFDRSNPAGRVSGRFQHRYLDAKRGGRLADD